MEPRCGILPSTREILWLSGTTVDLAVVIFIVSIPGDLCADKFLVWASSIKVTAKISSSSYFRFNHCRLFYQNIIELHSGLPSFNVDFSTNQIHTNTCSEWPFMGEGRAKRMHVASQKRTATQYNNDTTAQRTIQRHSMWVNVEKREFKAAQL